MSRKPNKSDSLPIAQQQTAPVTTVTSREIKAVVVVCGGLREAARRLNISEDMVRQRCRRERWKDDPAVARAIEEGRKRRSLSPAVVTTVSPVEAIACEFDTLGKDSRMRLARGLNKGARHVETMPGKEVLENAHEVKAIVSATETVHPWKNSSMAAKIQLRLTGAHQVEASAIVVEADWFDANEPQPEPVPEEAQNQSEEGGGTLAKPTYRILPE